MLRSLLRVFLLLNLVVLVGSIMLAFSGRGVFEDRVDSSLWTIAFAVVLGAAAIVEAIASAEKNLLAKLDSIPTAGRPAEQDFEQSEKRIIDAVVSASRALARKIDERPK